VPYYRYRPYFWMPYYGSTRTVYRTVTRVPEAGSKYGPVLRMSTATVESPTELLKEASVLIIHFAAHKSLLLAESTENEACTSSKKLSCSQHDELTEVPYTPEFTSDIWSESCQIRFVDLMSSSAERS
jgi:hypothetical protein